MKKYREAYTASRLSDARKESEMKKTISKKIKVIYATLLTATLLYGGICASAEEYFVPENSDDGQAYEYASTENTAEWQEASNGESDAETVNGTAAFTGTETDASAETPDGRESESITGEANNGSEQTAKSEDEQMVGNGNFFAEIYNGFISNAGVIFSTLSFIASLILSFVYNKCLMPMIKGSTGSLKTAIKSINDTISGQGNLSMDKISEQSEIISDMKLEISELKSSVSAACEKLGERNDESIEKEKMRIVMQNQIDMLYDIFMTSALPQYKKDDVGSRIAAMKEQLKING